MSKTTILKGLFVVYAMVVIPMGFGCMYVWYQLLYRPLNIPEEGYTFVVSPGSNISQIANQLYKADILPTTRWIRWMSILQGSSKKLKVGEYRIADKMTTAELLRKIVDGKVAQYAFTVVEGWRFEDLLHSLHKHPKIKNTLESKSIAEIMAELEINHHPEGAFLADTYYFTSGSTDKSILRRANIAMANKLNFIWNTRRQTTLLTAPYEALILASIIEKESSTFDEYHEISGVYHRRLQNNMRLQADPTVIYAVQDLHKNSELNIKYNGKLYRTHLKVDSPYNTYRYSGLPPTPIAIPSLRALDAALHPLPGESLYFVATGTGGHKFSKTLEEHNQAVVEYRAVVNSKKL